MVANKTTVLIVDDHPIFRHGVGQLIDADSSFQVIGEANDGEAAVTQVKALKPKIVTLDLGLPRLSGLEVIRRLRNLSPICLVLTANASESSFNAAMDAGAKGYMLKETAIQDLLTGLRAVSSGGVYVCPGVSSFLLRRRQRASALRQDKTGLTSLTPTELEVLRLVSENKTNKEIAADLFISPRTVEAHRANLCKKLELQGAHKLLQFAIEHRSEL